jgi:hypothetical protein
MGCRIEFSGRCNEMFSSLTGGEFLDQLSDYHFLRKDRFVHSVDCVILEHLNLAFEKLYITIQGSSKLRNDSSSSWLDHHDRDPHLHRLSIF